MTDTTAQHIAARNDPDLLERMIAAAEQAHIPEPENFVRMNIGRLVSTPIDESADTVTTVHAFANQHYQEAVAALPTLPGKDPAAVTDAQLAAAVQAVWSPPSA